MKCHSLVSPTLRLGWLLCGFVLPFGLKAAPIVPPTDAEPIKIIQTEPATFPLRLAQQNVTRGWSKVVVGIDASGKLADALVIGCSHPEFAASALTALRQWQFVPARAQGEAIFTVTQLDFHFRDKTQAASVVTQPNPDNAERVEAKTRPESNLLVRFDELDCLPIPIHLVSPAYSAEDAQRHAGKKVVVRFYIDETGKVRLPTLAYADDLVTARQALAAVAEWRFIPPKYQNQPVITRTSQTFEFKGSPK
jgi:TonB family protein